MFMVATVKTSKTVLFFTVFPQHCVSYVGPHSTQCLTSLWKSAGCVKTGLRYPGKLTEKVQEHLKKLNLRLANFKFKDECLIT